MAFQIALPKIGFSMADAMLAEWLVEDGAQVTEGQPLYSLESEKSVQEVESPASGTLHILATAGQEYPVGHLLGEIV
jgi:pyruvate/2-oxoglutarate dehydrogenase complex dihydrolipoamide acyltransferase (E2) component